MTPLRFSSGKIIKSDNIGVIFIVNQRSKFLFMFLGFQGKKEQHLKLERVEKFLINTPLNQNDSR